MSIQFEEILKTSRKIHVEQVHEGFEIVLGVESRNKYRILDELRTPIAFAAEASSGLGGTILRMLFKHWRTFQIHIFDQNRNLMYRSHFPFRWFFKTLYLDSASGERLGHLEQRFAILRKKFDLYDERGTLIAQVNSPFFKFWTFEFTTSHRKIGTVQKKWSGAISEMFTDKDNFIVSFADKETGAKTKALMVAACLMIDIIYFENNKGISVMDLAD